MEQVSVIGIDLAKRVFHLHGATKDGQVVFRKKMTRPQLSAFIAACPICIIAMEACGSAHHWGRLFEEFGHEVRLIPPAYVKPFVKRQKNDTNDAEAISEAAMRPTMLYVDVKTKDQQAQAMVFRSREMAVKHRTQLINALRSYLAEFGHVAPSGARNLPKVSDLIESDENDMPASVRILARDQLDEIKRLDDRIEMLERQLRVVTAAGERTACMRSVPGVGPITAAAIEAFAPALSSFKRGRDFAAWLGLVPKQHSTGGKERMGRISKMHSQRCRASPAV